MIKGTNEPNGSTIVGEFRVNGELKKKDLDEARCRPNRRSLVARAEAMLQPGQFFCETRTESGAVLSMRGTIDDGWHPAELTIADRRPATSTYADARRSAPEYHQTISTI